MCGKKGKKKRRRIGKKKRKGKERGEEAREEEENREKEGRREKRRADKTDLSIFINNVCGILHGQANFQCCSE